SSCRRCSPGWGRSRAGRSPAAQGRTRRSRPRVRGRSRARTPGHRGACPRVRLGPASGRVSHRSACNGAVYRGGEVAVSIPAMAQPTPPPEGAKTPREEVDPDRSWLDEGGDNPPGDRQPRGPAGRTLAAVGLTAWLSLAIALLIALALLWIGGEM